MVKPTVTRQAMVIQGMGREPSFDDEPTQAQLDVAYNWFNAMYTSDEAKEFALQYLASIDFDEDVLAKLADVRAGELRIVGWNCQLLMNGSVLPDFALDYIFEKAYALADTVRPAVATIAPIVIDVQKRIDDKVDDLIGDIEEQVDIFTLNGENDEFDPVAFLTERNVKPTLAERISDYYVPLYEELEEVLAGTDPQLIEGYKRLSKKKLQAKLNFIAAIIAACEERQVTVKAQRLPRKKKARDPIKAASKMNYLAEYPDLSLKSIRPSEIIGAHQLWVFNTKTRFLGVYNSSTATGFDVKGSTIYGFDEKTSVAKKLRKPQAVINEVLGAGKIALRRVLDSVKTAEKQLTGRVNADTVLLRVLK